MGCPYAPIGEVKKMVDQSMRLVNIFPRLLKGDIQETESTFKNLCRRYYPELRVVRATMTCEGVLKQYSNKIRTEQALAFLFSKKLMGKRHSGSQSDILLTNATRQVCVTCISGKAFAPILLTNVANGRAAIVSAIDAELNKTVLKIDGLNVTIEEADARA